MYNWDFDGIFADIAGTPPGALKFLISVLVLCPLADWLYRNYVAKTSTHHRSKYDQKGSVP